MKINESLISSTGVNISLSSVIVMLVRSAYLVITN